MKRETNKANQREIICRYGDTCLNDGAPSPITSTVKREWCKRGATCNRPHNHIRDELGISELEERLALNSQLLSSWNKWTRSPYCQCIYSSGQKPSGEYCKHCNRPMTPESARGLNAVEFEEHERIRRLRAGRSWIVVYENIVRAAEVGLKLLIKATGPAPEGEVPTYGKHDLRALWEKVPACAKDEVRAEMLFGPYEANSIHVISAVGEAITEPLSIREQPIFDKFGWEFNSIRYAWDELPDKGVDGINESAQKWPDPINLYYLHSASQAVASVLQGQPWNSDTQDVRWNRRVQLFLGLDDSSFFTDWPRAYIDEEPKTLKVGVRGRRTEPASGSGGARA